MQRQGIRPGHFWIVGAMATPSVRVRYALAAMPHAQRPRRLVRLCRQQAPFVPRDARRAGNRDWEIESGKEVGVFTDFKGPIKACHISRNGRTGLATDGATMLELTLTGKTEVKRRRQLSRSWSSGQSAAFSNDGALVAVGDSSDVKLWNVNTGKELPKMEAGEIQWSMAFTPDGSRLITGGADKINVWDVRKLRRMHSQEVPDSGNIQCLAASPDNKHVAATGRKDVYVVRLPAAP